MRKRINGIITLICFICLLIGAAGLDAKNPAGAIALIVIALIGIVSESFYWRRIYER